MKARGAAIHINLKITDDEDSSIIFSSQEERAQVKTNLRKSHLPEMRKELRIELEEFRRYFDGKLIEEEPSVEEWVQLSKAMKRLHEQGRTLTYQLFGTDFTKVQNLFVKSCRRQDGTAAIPLLEIQSSVENMVPFELLPLLNLSEPPEIASVGELEAVARRFLGFSTIIRRFIPNSFIE